MNTASLCDTRMRASVMVSSTTWSVVTRTLARFCPRALMVAIPEREEREEEPRIDKYHSRP